jgi:hypothetical protein
MLIKILVICSFLWTLLYIIVGTVQANKLCDHIKYNNFLRLWNLTQLHIFNSIKLDYELNDEKSKKLFLDLKRTIIIFYIVGFPLFILTSSLNMFLS